jgi:hypothetical protein
MLSFANVLDRFLDELTRLSARRFPLALGCTGTFQGLLLRHRFLLLARISLLPHRRK